MITCPLCNEKVKDPVDQKFVEDGHANNFYCPNCVCINSDKRLCHFNRKQLKYLVDGKTAYSYQAIVPPFQITWNEPKGKVTVYKLDREGNREEGHVYQSEKTNYETFLKTCERFKILVPFS